MFLNEIGYTISLPSEKFDLMDLTDPSRPPQHSLGKARVSHASQYFDADTQVTVEQKHSFLGLFFNLGQDFHYAFPGMKVPPGIFRKNHFMFVYLPRATLSYTLTKGTVTTFACQVPIPYVRTWQNVFPVLRGFLDKAERGVAATLMAQPDKISKDVLKAIDQTLNNTFDPFFRDVYFCIKIMDLVDGCLRQLAPVDKESAPSSASRPAVEKARTFIIQHLQDNLSIDQLAEAVGLEPRTLSRNFKKLYRLTVMNFLFEERMKKAVVLLRTSQLPISKIADAVGYRSLSNFSDAFTRKFGYSPSTLRQRTES
jgi:AraC family transcriptional regulator, transcriptional activator of the genes for pyochelin and ferripyochelin receptors